MDTSRGERPWIQRVPPMARADRDGLAGWRTRHVARLAPPSHDRFPLDEEPEQTIHGQVHEHVDKRGDDVGKHKAESPDARIRHQTAERREQWSCKRINEALETSRLASSKSL